MNPLLPWVQTHGHKAVDACEYSLWWEVEKKHEQGKERNTPLYIVGKVEGLFFCLKGRGKHWK